MHFQQIIEKATMEFLLPPKNTRTPFFYGLPKINKPGCLSALLFLDVIIQVTIFIPTSPILFNL